MIYCPRCDKRITPDHRCLNRRHFFGMLAGAAALLAAPKPLPVFSLNPTPDFYVNQFLRAGDSLSLTFASAGSEICDCPEHIATLIMEGK